MLDPVESESTTSSMATTVAGVLSLILGLEAVVVLVLSLTTERPLGMGILLERDQIEIPMRINGGRDSRWRSRNGPSPRAC